MPAIRLARAVLASSALLLLTFATNAAAEFQFQPVVEHVREPVYVTAPPRDSTRFFVVQSAGIIRVVQNGQLVAKPFLDISKQVQSGGLRGMLSMAFAPDYARSGHFYVFYTDRRGVSRVDRFTRSSRDADVADPKTQRHILRQPLRRKLPEDHIGGQLQFGPDGYLYVSLGDAGTGYANPRNRRVHNALDLGTWLGKILRIDPRGRTYRVPRSNPFVHRPGARPEIFARGLRNPWRFSFDGHDIAIGDPGEQSFEEINFLSLRRARGADFGWPVYEGSHRFRNDIRAPHAVMPALDYRHHATSDPNCGGAVIGGYVVRDRALPSLYGRYLFGDYCFAEIRSFDPADPRASDALVPVGPLPRLNSFGEDAQHHIYGAFEDGTVRELVER